MKVWSCLCVAAALTGNVAARDFPTFPLVTRLDPVQQERWTWYGGAMCIEDDLAVVGAPQVNPMEPDAGAAYVYRRVGELWFFESKLTPSSATPHARFGAALALRAGRLFIGAPHDSTQVLESGAVFVFEFAGGVWSESARVFAQTPRERAHFGEALAAGFERVVVGAPGDFGAAERSGAVHVFDNLGGSWLPFDELTASDSRTGDEFGKSLAIDGARVLVGAPHALGQNPTSGAAYLFSVGGSQWNLLAKLAAPASDPTSNHFGAVVSLDHVTAVSEWIGNRAGVVHLFGNVAGQWVRRVRLESPEWGPRDGFGAALAVQWNSDGILRLFVGAPYRNESFDHAGAVYVFQSFPSGWHPVGKLVSSDACDYAGFGTALAVAGDQLFSSSPGNPGFNPFGVGFNGCAWVRQIAEHPLVGEAYCFGDGSAGPCGCGNEVPPGTASGCASSTGSGAMLRARGSASLTIGDFEPVATGLAPWSKSLLLGSRKSLNPGRTVGDGLACISAPRERYTTLWSDAGGSASWPALSSGFYPWLAGETWHFQVWFRNLGQSACGSGVQLTNALEVHFTP